MKSIDYEEKSLSILRGDVTRFSQLYILLQINIQVSNNGSIDSVCLLNQNAFQDLLLIHKYV